MKFKPAHPVSIFFISLLFIIYPVCWCCAQAPAPRESKPGRVSNTPAIGNGNIVLGSPTATSIIANVILEKDGEAFIEYSITAGKYNNKTPVTRSADGEPVEIIIQNLIANTRYYYRLNYRLSGEKNFLQSPGSWFSTQKKFDAEFSFGVQGDSHPEREGRMFNRTLYAQTLDSVAQKKT